MRRKLLDAQTEECPMCTVSDLIERHSLKCIDLLKVDVEGAELDVLRGIRPEHWPWIRQVSNFLCAADTSEHTSALYMHRKSYVTRE